MLHFIYKDRGQDIDIENAIRLQLYSILKSYWSGAWLLLPIVTWTVNSIVSAGYSRKIVLMRVKWNLDCANFELTNHIAYRVENKSLISTPRKLISTAGKLIFQVREYTRLPLEVARGAW